MTTKITKHENDKNENDEKNARKKTQKNLNIQIMKNDENKKTK